MNFDSPACVDGKGISVVHGLLSPCKLQMYTYYKI